MSKQKEIFLQSEGDAWFTRNKQSVATRKLPEDDDLLREVLALPVNTGVLKVLEIGCGDWTRLAWLKNNLMADCCGIEPSAQAGVEACTKGIKVQPMCCHSTMKVLILLFLDSAFICVIVKTCFALLAKQIEFYVNPVG